MEKIFHFFEDYNIIETKSIKYIIFGFITIALFFCFSIKSSIDKKNMLFKNYVKLNYAIRPCELTEEDEKLIRLTFKNTLKNKKSEKIKENVGVSKDCRHKEKKVSFSIC